jgi:hypothetical protein
MAWGGIFRILNRQNQPGIEIVRFPSEIWCPLEKVMYVQYIPRKPGSVRRGSRKSNFYTQDLSCTNSRYNAQGWKITDVV